jgi:hypothetical protein
VSGTVVRHSIGLMALLLAVAGCGPASVSVPTTQFPVPVMDRVPLDMGVLLDDKLQTYAHSETLDTGREWHIELGSAQRPMFENLLAGMFAHSAVVAALPASNVDGVIVPSIEELQFSTPQQTKSNYFEVWIRYQIRLHDQDGTLIAEWPLTAYGQSNARNFGMSKGDDDALQAAALAACRDAMAFFIVQFHTIPAVEAWLAAKTGGPKA